MFTTKQHKQFNSQVSNSKGFSLVEILIVVAITGIISVLINDFIMQSTEIQRYIYEQSEAIAEAQEGTELLVKELREASFSDDGAYPLELANEQELIFYSDIDLDANTERIRYFIEDNSLKKGIVEPTSSPAEYTADEDITVISAYVVNQENSVFKYYNENYPVDEIDNPLSYPADVTDTTLAKIHLEINVNPEKIPDTYILESFVQIRNFKDNL